MIFFDHRPNILQIVCKMNIHILTVAQQILTIHDDLILCILRKHCIQYFHCLLATCFILCQIAVQCHLEIWRSHQPLFAVLFKEWEKCRVDSLVLKHFYTV